MLRSVWVGVVLAVCGVLPATGQSDPSSLEGYFTGKMVVAKVDMPGSEKGIDLAFNKPAPLDWKDYSSRLNAFGVAIHKGDAVRVTKLVVKGDHIEFQLNGGGFGVAGDDTNTTVAAVVTPKSDREKDLEKQVGAAKDPKLKRDLQDDLDRERSRRERQDADNKNAAMIASQMKAQQVADRRLRGGSRFNLRWKDSIPPDEKSPDAVMQLLAEYVDFDASHAGTPSSYPPPVQVVPTPDISRPAYVRPATTAAGSAGASQVQRGMKMDDVTSMMGQGRSISQSVSPEGLRTQVIEFRTADSLVDVTFVEGVVVKYSINSR